MDGYLFIGCHCPCSRAPQQFQPEHTSYRVDVVTLTSRPYALDILERFTHLEEFGCTESLYPGITAYLASSETLCKLRIRMPREYSSALRPNPPYHTRDFSALVNLTVHGIREPDLFLRFMRTISSRALEVLELLFDIPEIQLVPSMELILGSISTFVRLQDVTLVFGNPEEPGDDFPIYDIAPLTRLRQLRALRLASFGIREALVDDTIPDLARAWPDFEFLSYNQNIPHPVEPAGLTLKALELFAGLCPKLSGLCLDLDASVAPPPLPTPLSTGAVELDLTWSLVDRETFAGVAAYISSVMPNAYMIVNAEPDSTDETMY